MAEDEPDPEVDEVEETDPVTLLQNALAEIDPSALVVGFICIAEWFEEDGSQSFSVHHSPMPPWHYTGLLQHTMDLTAPDMFPVMIEMGEDDEDE